jgi:hypothetical protein
MKLTLADKTPTKINNILSNLNEIDMELTDFNNTMSDMIDSRSKPSDKHKSPSISANDDFYNFIKNHLLTLNPKMTMALSKLTYHTNFHLHFFSPNNEKNFGKTFYKKTPPDRESEDGLESAGDIETCLLWRGLSFSIWNSHYCEGESLCGVP